MKTISERFLRYTKTRFLDVPNKAKAADVIADAEESGVNAFDALVSFRDESGGGIFGTPMRSARIARMIEFAFMSGKVPMYDYKPGVGRPKGSKNAGASIKESEMRDEIAALKIALRTARLGGAPDADTVEAIRGVVRDCSNTVEARSAAMRDLRKSPNADERGRFMRDGVEMYRPRRLPKMEAEMIAHGLPLETTYAEYLDGKNRELEAAARLKNGKTKGAKS